MVSAGPPCLLGAPDASVQHVQLFEQLTVLLRRRARAAPDLLQQAVGETLRRGTAYRVVARLAASAEVHYDRRYPVLVNDPATTELAREPPLRRRATNAPA